MFSQKAIRIIWIFIAVIVIIGMLGFSITPLF